MTSFIDLGPAVSEPSEFSNVDTVRTHGRMHGRTLTPVLQVGRDD